MGTKRWFLYDGDCAFCSACARFLERYVGADVTMVPWQFADLTALGLTAQQCDRAVQWVSVSADGRRESAAGAAAIAAYLRRGGAVKRGGALARRGVLWRPVGRLLATRPILVAAEPVYDFVARHRDRMPGGTATCALPAERRPTERRPTEQRETERRATEQTATEQRATEQRATEQRATE